MLKYSSKRLLQSFVTIFLVISLVFLLLRLMPVSGYFGENYLKLSENQKIAILNQYGLTLPVWEQYLNFWKNLVIDMDFGTSVRVRTGIPVLQILGERIPFSVQLSFGILIFTYLLGIPLGILYSKKKDGLIDSLGHGYYVLSNSIPQAVQIILFQIYLTSLLGLPMLFSTKNAMTWIVPIFCGVFTGVASLAISLRRFMVDQANQDYIRLAKSKGVSEKNILYKHIFRNVWVFLVRGLAANVVLSISGYFFIESLFSIPGMGTLLLTAVGTMDNPLIQAIVLLTTLMSIIAIFAGDILVMLVDPRIKLDSKGGSR